MVRMQSSPKGQAAKGPRVPGLLPALILVLLASCAPQPPETPAMVFPSEPVSTSTPVPQRATAEPKSIDIGNGGFTIAVQPGLEFEAHDDSISISDQSGELVISLNGRPYVESVYTLPSFLGKYLAELTSRGGSFDQGEPYEIVIDGTSGIAIDFSGSFLDQPVTGKAIAVSPGQDFIVFGLGMSLLNRRENAWLESGSPLFETILDSIDFKDKVK